MTQPPQDPYQPQPGGYPPQDPYAQQPGAVPQDPYAQQQAAYAPQADPYAAGGYQPQFQPPVKKKSSPLIIIGVVAVVVIAAIVFAVIKLTGGQGSDTCQAGANTVCVDLDALEPLVVEDIANWNDGYQMTVDCGSGWLEANIRDNSFTCTATDPADGEKYTVQIDILSGSGTDYTWDWWFID
jgi:hypothetical protein